MTPVREVSAAPLDLVEFCALELYGRRCYAAQESQALSGCIVVWANARDVEPRHNLSFARYSALRASGAEELSL